MEQLGTSEMCWRFSMQGASEIVAEMKENTVKSLIFLRKQVTWEDDNLKESHIKLWTTTLSIFLTVYHNLNTRLFRNEEEMFIRTRSIIPFLKLSMIKFKVWVKS